MTSIKNRSISLISSKDLIENATEIEYIFELKLSCDSSHLFASASDKSVHIFDVSSGSKIGNIKAHNDTINSVVTSNNDSNIFNTCSSDNYVKSWDIRTPQQCVGSIKFSEEVNAISVNRTDLLLAVASENKIFFYDNRMVMGGSQLSFRKHLGLYSDIHSDIVTQLQFLSHPNFNDSCLLSGGEDGLMCVYNTASSEYEDAVISIMNTDCPIRKFGFFGPSLEGIYCLSTIETASLWHYPSAQRISSFPDIRTAANVDYLVNCEFDPSTSELFMIAGTNDGTTKFIEMQPNQFDVFDSFTLPDSVIRSTCSLVRNNVFEGIFLGGEDGKIHLMKIETNSQKSSINYESQNNINLTPAANGQTSKKTQSTGSIKNHKNHGNGRFAPY